MSNDKNKETENCKFFSNKKCEYFPCHEAEDEDGFICMFCYCPLYALGEGCGGDYVYLENGIKDCSNCVIPHGKDSYDYIVSRYEEVAELARKRKKPIDKTNDA